MKLRSDIRITRSKPTRKAIFKRTKMKKKINNDAESEALRLRKGISEEAKNLEISQPDASEGRTRQTGRSSDNLEQVASLLRKQKAGLDKNNETKKNRFQIKAPKSGRICHKDLAAHIRRKQTVKKRLEWELVSDGDADDHAEDEYEDDSTRAAGLYLEKTRRSKTTSNSVVTKATTHLKRKQKPVNKYWVWERVEDDGELDDLALDQVENEDMDEGEDGGSNCGKIRRSQRLSGGVVTEPASALDKKPVLKKRERQFENQVENGDENEGGMSDFRRVEDQEGFATRELLSRSKRNKFSSNITSV
ncbi:hypothetical protein BC829DRAFT_141614 [Chytridium lagenaria]|nr:hypothetical protein BC829DRAFT_141614 [Chytridium lagenaria]